MTTSKSFITAESTVKINGEAGADHAWSVEGVVDGAGRVSVQIDLGGAPRASIFDWSGELLSQATPTQGGTGDFYRAGAPDDDSTQIDGDVGASDAALGDVDQIRNLHYIGSVISEEADTTKMVSSGTFTHTQRYLSLVFDNNLGATVNATDSNFVFKLTARAWQGQAT
jgi:hypothetical protein